MGGGVGVFWQAFFIKRFCVIYNCILAGHPDVSLAFEVLFTSLAVSVRYFQPKIGKFFLAKFTANPFRAFPRPDADPDNFQHRLAPAIVFLFMFGNEGPDVRHQSFHEHGVPVIVENPARHVAFLRQVGLGDAEFVADDGELGDGDAFRLRRLCGDGGAGGQGPCHQGNNGKAKSISSREPHFVPMVTGGRGPVIESLWIFVQKKGGLI